MDQIKVLIIDELEKNRNLSKNILSKIDYITLVGEAGSQEEGLYMMEDSDPDVVLISAGISGDGYEFAEKITLEYPHTGLIIVEDKLAEDTMYKAILVGAKDILIEPYSPSKLVDSIYRTYQLLKKSEGTQKGTPRSKRHSRKGNVITVFSTKGGVGKTFVSVNLAVALAQQTNKKVALVDLDLDYGNVALALNVVPRFTIADVVDDIRNIDPDIIESYFSPHESGVKVLAANVQPQIHEFINNEHIDIIIGAIQSNFDYIIVDMPARFHSPVSPAFQYADMLLLVTTPEISTVRNIKSSIATLQELNYPKSKVKILLNKADSKTQIKNKDVETTLSQNLYGSINANYKLATLSLNSGVPVVTLKPRSAVSRSFANLAKRIASESRSSR